MLGGRWLACRLAPQSDAGGKVPVLVWSEGFGRDVCEVLVGGDLGELDDALSIQMSRTAKRNADVLGLIA